MFMGNGSGIFIWSDGIVGLVLSIIVFGIYVVIFIDVNGCIVLDSLSFLENSIDFIFMLGYIGCLEFGVG